MGGLGGSTSIHARGLGVHHVTVHIDGMQVDNPDCDFCGGKDMNPGLAAEFAMTTSSSNAEVQTGGFRTNLIPREGGNTQSGNVYVGWTGLHLQTGNIDDNLRAQGMKSSGSRREWLTCGRRRSHALGYATCRTHRREAGFRISLVGGHPLGEFLEPILDAINELDAQGRSTNALAVEVGDSQVRFLVNGTEVATQPRSAVDTDGITGLRVTHFLSVHIDDLMLGM